MTLKDLKALRQEKVKEMEKLVELRSESMDSETLAAVKSFKEEIKDIDQKIEAIEELRSVASVEANPVKKENNAKEEIRSLFNDYLRGNISEKELEKRANSVGTNSDVVPEDFLRELFETIDNYGKIAPKARNITTADNGTLSIPVINDTQNSGVWVQELGAIPLSDLTTDTIQMKAFKVGTGIEISTELMEDSFFDLGSYLAKALGERIGRTVENAYIKGDGNEKPLGIVNDPKTVNVVTATAGSVDIDDLIAMISAIPYNQRAGAEFLVSEDLYSSLISMKDADGRPLLQPQAQATPADDVKYTIQGYPVSPNFELDQVAEGNVVAIFGNLNNYIIRNVRNVTVKLDDYSSMGNDAIKFYATARVDGKVVSGNTCFAKLTVKTTKK